MRGIAWILPPPLFVFPLEVVSKAQIASKDKEQTDEKAQSAAGRLDGVLKPLLASSEPLSLDEKLKLKKLGDCLYETEEWDFQQTSVS